MKDEILVVFWIPEGLFFFYLLKIKGRVVLIMK